MNKKVKGFMIGLLIPLAVAIGAYGTYGACRYLSQSEVNSPRQVASSPGIESRVETRPKVSAEVDTKSNVNTEKPEVENKEKSRSYVSKELSIPTAKKERSISQRGLDLIKEFEGFSERVYVCPAGKETIGYGHVVGRNERFGVLSRQDAEKLLVKDISPAERTVRKNVKVNLTPNQYDALCSFVYNVGEGNFAGSTLVKKLNCGDYSGANTEFSKWVYGNGKKLKGLEKRREREKSLFFSSSE